MATDKETRTCVLCDRTRAEAKHLVGDDKGVVCEQCVGRSMILMCQAGWIPPNVKINISVVPIASAQRSIGLVDDRPRLSIAEAAKAVREAQDAETPSGG